MKKTILIFMLLCATFGYGQVTLKKTWIGPDAEYLKIGDSIAEVDFSRKSKFIYILNEKKLIFIDNFDSVNSLEIQTFPFQINRLTNDSLVLIALSNESSKLIYYLDTMVFVDSAKIIVPKFKFQKLFFKAEGGCLGICRVLNVEIDSIGNVFFQGIYNTGKYLGFYKGKMGSRDLSKLVDLLKDAKLDSYSDFPDNGFRGIDQPYYYFVVNYNNKVVATTLIPNSSDGNILRFLQNCYENAHLKKVRSFNDNFGQYKIELGKYKSAKGYPDFRCVFLNDTLMNVISSSRFYSSKLGLAKYGIKDKDFIINYALVDLVEIKDTASSTDSIDLFFKVVDFVTKESLPYVNIWVQGIREKVKGTQTNMHGEAKIRIKKPLKNDQNYLALSFIGYNRFKMKLDVNGSKSIVCNMTEVGDEKVFNYQIRSITKNRIVLTNELGIDLVLEREIE